MMEIYTPAEWNSFFGGAPSLYIKDDGYIYTREEEVKIAGRPCGRIDFRKGRIYGQDYGAVNPDPIGYLQKENGITEIYAEPPGWNVKPILVMAGKEIYPYSEYIRIMGGSPSGYVDGAIDPGKKGGTPSGGNSSKGKSGGNSGKSANSGNSGSSYSGCLGSLGVFGIIIGIFIVIMFIDEIRKDATDFFIFFAILASLMFLIHHIRKKNKDSKTPPAEPAKPAPTPKKPQPKPKKPTPAPKEPQAKPAKPTTEKKPPTKREPKADPKPTPEQAEPPTLQPAEKKIAVCPHCGAKCRVPAGIGTIQFPCPNPNCKIPFIFKS